MPTLPATTQAAPVADSAPVRGITITAHDADARSLLIAIAREAGVNLVVSSDVRRRVSLSLTNAQPEAAIAAIIAQAGLSVERGAQPTPAVVFYQLAVNVNEAPADVIAVRYGVSGELAAWVVETRHAKPIKP
jgi:type II secretory pathway component GspD/PulD (secretin)